MDHLATQEARLTAVATVVKAPAAEVEDRVKALMEERKSLANEVAQLRRELAMAGGAAGGAGPEPVEVGGLKLFAQALSGVSGKDLPPLIDEHKARMGSGAVLLIADTGGKAAVAAGVTGDLTDRLSAVDMVRAAVAVGVDGVFMEVHDKPSEALSDGANALALEFLPKMLDTIQAIDAARRQAPRL